MQHKVYPNKVPNTKIYFVDDLIRQSLKKGGFVSLQDMRILTMPLYMLLVANLLVAVNSSGEDVKKVFDEQLGERDISTIFGIFTGTYQQKFLIWATSRAEDNNVFNVSLQDVTIKRRLFDYLSEKFTINEADFGQRIFHYGKFTGTRDTELTKGPRGLKSISCFGAVFFDEDFAVSDEIGFLNTSDIIERTLKENK